MKKTIDKEVSHSDKGVQIVPLTVYVDGEAYTVTNIRSGHKVLGVSKYTKKPKFSKTRSFWLQLQRADGPDKGTVCYRQVNVSVNKNGSGDLSFSAPKV